MDSPIENESVVKQELAAVKELMILYNKVLKSNYFDLCGLVFLFLFSCCFLIFSFFFKESEKAANGVCSTGRRWFCLDWSNLRLEVLPKRCDCRGKS